VTNYSEQKSDSAAAGDQDLAWQAYLYVSGEMTPAASSKFEERLAADQDAREAVAQAVDLWSMLAAAPQAAVPARPVRRQRSAIAAVLATMAALIGVFFSLNRGPSAPEGEATGDLVSLWTASQDLSDDETDGTGTDQVGDQDELTVPGWMIAALETDADDDTEEN